MLNNTLIDPQSIAIVGASRNPGKPGGRLVINMVDSGYAGNIFPVNPREPEICGLQVYASIHELPDTDLAILAIAPEQCVETVELMSAEKGTRSFIIISAGFSELGSEGKVLEDRLKELAQVWGLSIIGPNCIGLLNKNYKAIFVSPLPPVTVGGVDFVTASGALAVFLFEMAAKYGLRFGSVFTVGNSATIGVEEVLGYWDDNFVTGSSGTVKMIYVEQIRKPGKFYRHIQSLREKGCDVIVLKPGDTKAGARAAMSHTGAFAGDAGAYDLLIKKAGAIRCFSREELVYTANILSLKKPLGRRLAIITHAGGPGVMLADQLQKAGIEVPEFTRKDKENLLSVLHKGASAGNPIDIMATANRSQLKFAVEYCDNMPDIDGTVVIYGKTGMEDLFGTYKFLHYSVISCTKPVYTILPSINSANDEIESYINLGHQVYTDEVIFGRCLSSVLNIPKLHVQDLIPALEIKNTLPETLSDEEVFSRLVSIGINAETPLFFKSLEEIQEIRGLIFPVAVKTMGILHKTEFGGVALNVSGREDLVSVAEKMLDIPGAKGVMVQKMMPGHELYLGGKRHEGIGFSVYFGLGGVFVELVKDAASTLAPVSEEETLDMIELLKGKALFEGFRNKEPIDKEAFARVVQQFSTLFAKYPDIREIDINPLIAHGKLLTVVDARIILDVQIKK